VQNRVFALKLACETPVGDSQMPWWEILLLMLFAIAAFSVAWETWHWYRCPSCRIAKGAVTEWHPDWRAVGTSHRATEVERDVVAVFYRLPRVVTFPTPYCLVAVNRTSRIAVELPDDDNSVYAIRGRK
jgi:hypothetical protein